MSEQNKHTPGPWRVDAFSGLEVTASKPGILEGSRQIADCSNKLMPEEVCKSNARLIAAAPDLLEACQNAASWFRCLKLVCSGAEFKRDHNDAHKELSNLESAIAKAEGRS